MRCRRGLFALLLAPALGAQTLALDPVAVTAARAAQPAAQVPFSLVVLGGATLRHAPTVSLDGALRAVPGFSLFRRNDSLSANPTTQGVSLRGLGPSGASRSLVLLDGIPLNDPFGGWVAWTKLPRESLAGAELVRGGGAAAWGNAALGGVIQILSEKNVCHLIDDKGSGRLAASAGDFGTRSMELAIAQRVGAGVLQVTGRDFSTDGFKLIAPEDRGPVDVAAWSEHRRLTLRWSRQVGERATVSLAGRTYHEHRGNGTAYQRNSSDEIQGSVALELAPADGFGWTALAYRQGQTFSSTFSSVNAARTVETPASDQFAVPAVALGAAWTGTWQHAADARTNAGADWRRVKGETREHYTYANGDFTRLRVAGGAQEFAGLFALHERVPATDWRLTLGARLDHWRETDGHRRESDRATGTVLRDEAYSDRDGFEFSPSGGLVWTPVPAWRLRAAAQHAFRRPTLNELYRPFRVGNVITEANAALGTEQATSAELGVEYRRGDLRLGLTAFHSELHDAVGNVTLYRGPGTFPVIGTVPAGGSGRQRLNLDRIRVQGLEFTARWQPMSVLTLDAAYLYNEAVVRRATVAPALVGRRLAQVARHSARLEGSWRIGRLNLSPRLRAIGRQFEDDENLLVLGTAVIADLGARVALTARGELFITAENLADARIETGRSADGVVNTGTPRLVFGGMRWQW